MKAIMVREYGDPEVMKIDETPNPIPGVGQVVVRILGAGVNPADTYSRSGNYANKPPLPFTPGTDGAGLIDSVGPGVTLVKPGDRVYLARSLSGTYAEYALALESQVHPLPERISFSQGAGVYVPYATAYRALTQLARARAGETILVHGASGGVGIAALQFANAAGLRVIGTAGSAKGRELVYMILFQVAFTSLTGFGLGTGLSAVMMEVARLRIPDYVAIVTFGNLALAFVMVLVIASVSSYIGVRKVLKIEPFDIFRG